MDFDDDSELKAKIAELEALFCGSRETSVRVVEEAEQIARIARASRPEMPSVKSDLTERFAVYKSLPQPVSGR